VGEAILEAWRRLCPDGERVAVRSSALEEGGVAHSFAGQSESFLGVSQETLLERVEPV
jgi:rifampicin phosphotransferase